VTGRRPEGPPPESYPRSSRRPGRDQGTRRPARSPAATATAAEDRTASPDHGGRPGGPGPFGAARPARTRSC